MPAIDKIEYEKRIRIVQEWLIDDWSPTDIIAQVNQKWGIEERQAKRYIADARERWHQEEQELLDKKRQRKVKKLQKLARTLKDEYKGTPSGIRAQLQVEREIITLESLRPATKVELTGAGGTDLFANKSDDELKKLLEETISKIKD